MIEDQVRAWAKTQLGDEVWEGGTPPEDRTGASLRLLWDNGLSAAVRIWLFERSYREASDKAGGLVESALARVGFCDGWAIRAATREFEGVDLEGRYVFGVTLDIEMEV